jgi:hypothetical protein
LVAPCARLSLSLLPAASPACSCSACVRAGSCLGRVVVARVSQLGGGEPNESAVIAVGARSTKQRRRRSAGRRQATCARVRRPAGRRADGAFPPLAPSRQAGLHSIQTRAY